MISIRELRPLDNSADAIRHALNRIASERAETLVAIAAAREARSDALLDGTPADIRKAEEASRDLQLRVEQLDAMADRFQPQLEAATLAEDLAEYDAAAAKLDEKKARMAAWLQSRYPKIVAEFTAFFEQENEIIQDAMRLASMRAAQRRLRPSTGVQIAASMPKGYIRPDLPGMPFAFLIRLPNIERGRALWNQEHHVLVPGNLEQFR